MSDTYTKLFGSITASTVWQEPAGTRLVWITMLAMADAHGCVWASVPGLARIANVTLDETVTALATLSAPDKWSRTPDNEGRRIEAIDGGWRLLNHAKYRAIRSADERRDYWREWKAAKRAEDKAGQSSESTECPQVSTKSTESTPPTPAPSPEKRSPSDSCPEPQAAAGRKVVGTMPTLGGGEWGVTQQLLDGWTAAYPGIDVKAELRKAKAWLLSNPTNAKTARGMGRFCNGWLERAQNAVGRNGTGPPPERESLQARVARKNGLSPLFGSKGEDDGRRTIGSPVDRAGGDLRPPLDRGDGGSPD